MTTLRRATTDDARRATPPLRRFVLAWLALLLLLAASCASAFVRLGDVNAVLNYGIAVVKAGIVVLVFMHLARGTTMVRIVAAAGLVALVLLVGLSATDFLMRGALT